MRRQGHDLMAKASTADDPYSGARERMVREQLARRDISDTRVLAAMGRVPRHEFVDAESRPAAYLDGPQPLALGQSISQPYIVALMTQLARPEPSDRALDVGTGSGYQAAVLAELCREVYSVEILKPLADTARRRLRQLGYANIEVRQQDGYQGCPQHAPYDLIVVAAAPDHIPQPLVDQLATGGRLVLPVGDQYQTLMVVERQPDGTTRTWSVTPVTFVPMTGQAQQRPN
jgi:protein-L-isoaspartate(D-aspartate) O-methyltransferase